MSTLLRLLSEPRLLLATVTALAVFGAAACLVQASWVLVRAAVTRAGAPRALRAALPWLAAAGGMALLSRLLWLDYLAVFRPGPMLATVMAIRSAVLKLILVGFAKAVLVALLVVLLFPVLRLGLAFGPRPWLIRLEASWRRYVPKAAPYLVYYALLAVVVSLVTDQEILSGLPRVEMEIVARSLRRTLTVQVREMQALILGVFGAP